MAPVLSVQIYGIGFPGLVCDLRVGHFLQRVLAQVHQVLLETVLQPGPHTVVPAVAQHEAFVLRIVPVREQFGVECLGAVQGLGPELETFLRHIERIVAHQADLSALAQQQLARVIVQFDIAFVLDPFILYLAVNGVLERQLILDGIFANGQHAPFFIPQVHRIGHDRNQGQCVESVDEISSRDRIAWLGHSGPERTCPDHRCEVQLQPFPVVRGTVLGRRGPVCGIEDLRSLRNTDLDILGGTVLSRRNAERRLLCVSGKARPVCLERRRRIIIKKPGYAECPAVGYVRLQFRENHFVQHPSRWIRQGDGFPLQSADLEGCVGLSGCIL